MRWEWEERWKVVGDIRVQFDNVSVYRVQSTDGTKIGALKTLDLLSKRSAAASVDQFSCEVRALQMLHGTAVQVPATYESALGDRPYLITEFINGMTLMERASRGPVAVAEARRIVAERDRQLWAAWDAGVTHCEPHMQNIMLRPDGSLVLIDWAAAEFSGSCTPPMKSSLFEWLIGGPGGLAVTDPRSRDVPPE